jgi:hypothetical protein
MGLGDEGFTISRATWTTRVPQRPRVHVTRPLRFRDISFLVTQGTRGRVAYFYVQILTLRTKNVHDHAARVPFRSI